MNSKFGQDISVQLKWAKRLLSTVKTTVASTLMTLLFFASGTLFDPWKFAEKLGFLKKPSRKGTLEELLDSGLVMFTISQNQTPNASASSPSSLSSPSPDPLVDFLERIPHCPRDGWPRFCPHEDRVEWVFGGEMFFSVSLKQFVDCEQRGILPDQLCEEIMNEVRDCYH